MKKQTIHFEISERKILLRLFDLVSVLMALCFTGSYFQFDYFTITPENWTWIGVLIVYLSVFGTVFELYNLQKASRVERVFPNIAFTASTTVLFYLLTPYFTPELPNNRLQIVYFYLAIILALSAWRLVYVYFVASPRFYKKVLIVGELSTIDTIIQAFKQVDPNYKIVGFVNCEQVTDATVAPSEVVEYHPKDLHAVIAKESISEIVVASYNADAITTEIYSDLIGLLERGFPIKEYTQVYEDMTYRVPVQFVGKDFYKYFPFSRSNKNKLYLFFHRIFDLFFAVIGVVCGAFIIPFICLGNLIGNRGPLFYLQERVGKNGTVFKIIKLRTMVTDAEVNGAVWASKNDSRITPFGKFLRRSRLDEIPQFVNILKGEMSLIGPRPERPYFVKDLSAAIPFYETRHIIKPGLTGWAQINVRYGSSVEDSLMKLQYDLYYIKHRSFFLDLNIMVKTIGTMIYFRGQ
ncbi:sugar transferase [Bizionia sp. KMM 8389]